MDMTEQYRRQLAEVTAERIELTTWNRRNERFRFAAYLLTLTAADVLVIAGYRAFALGVFIGAIGSAAGGLFTGLWRGIELSRECRRLEIEQIEREGGLR